MSRQHRAWSLGRKQTFTILGSQLLCQGSGKDAMVGAVEGAKVVGLIRDSAWRNMLKRNKETRVWFELS